MSRSHATMWLVMPVLCAVVCGILAYPHLPALVASHWDVHGAVNGFMPRFWGAFFAPLLMLFFFGLRILLLRIDPLKKNIQEFQKYYDGMWMLLEGFILYVYVLTLAWNLGWQVDMLRMLIPALSVLFYGMGVILEKSKRNWFIGIRTPWTLSSDIVWEKTHALGSKLFKIAAFFSLGAFFVPEQRTFFLFLVAPILLVSATVIVYSYMEYRALHTK